MADRVLVTGVGGGVGQAVLKCLSGTSYDAVAYDSSPLAAGLYMTKHSWLGLNATHPDYVRDVISAAEKYHCRFVIPGHDIELLPLVENRSLFNALGINLVVSDPFLVSLADDKLETAKFLAFHGFDAPDTEKFEDFQWLDSAVVLKPRLGGARSKGTYIAHDEVTFLKYSKFIDPKNTVVQEWCPGDEFTCGTLTFEDNFVGAITMKRELRGGDTYKAFSIKDDRIQSVLEELCNLLKPKGPCNFQLKLHDNRVRIFELNARFSGTTYLRKLCGFDEVTSLLDMIDGKPKISMEWRELSLFRHWSEVVVENSSVLSRE
jgi:carbamoyl-phosphate synthase large subunit